MWSNEPIRFGYFRGAEPEYQELGLRLKSGMLSVCEQIKQLDEDSIIRLKSGQIDQLVIEGFQIGPKDIRTVFRKREEHFSFFEAQSNGNVCDTRLYYSSYYSSCLVVSSVKHVSYCPADE